MAMAKMGFASSLLVMFLAACSTVYGVDHTVGGSSGWGLPSSSNYYTSWASGETFTVGDNLVFTYDNSHGVDQVSQSDYNSCSSSNSLQSYTGGNTKIALNSTGNLYFICPTGGHCGSGMKLAINVVAAGTTPSTPTTPATSPSGSPSTPTTTTSSPPPPPSTNAADGITSNKLVMGSLMVSSVLLAFMS